MTNQPLHFQYLSVREMNQEKMEKPLTFSLSQILSFKFAYQAVLLTL